MWSDARHSFHDPVGVTARINITPAQTAVEHDLTVPVA
jgi:hypothetical protein